jgi:hypothetical protein
MGDAPPGPEVVSYDMTSTLPANKKFRLRWNATHLLPTSAVLWAIDDVAIKGTP